MDASERTGWSALKTPETSGQRSERIQREPRKLLEGLRKKEDLWYGFTFHVLNAYYSDASGQTLPNDPKELLAEYYVSLSSDKKPKVMLEGTAMSDEESKARIVYQIIAVINNVWTRESALNQFKNQSEFSLINLVENLKEKDLTMPAIVNALCSHFETQSPKTIYPVFYEPINKKRKGFSRLFNYSVDKGKQRIEQSDKK